MIFTSLGGRFCAALFLLLVAGLNSSPIGAASAAVARKSVLVVHSFNDQQPWQRKLVAGLQRRLDLNPGQLEVFEERMDAGRFSPAAQHRTFGDYLKSKYEKKSIDLLVVDSVPASLLLVSRPDILAGVPRLYVNPAPSLSETLSHTPGATLLTARNDLLRSFDAMLEVTRAKNVFVVGETFSTNVLNFVELIRANRQAGGRVERIDYLLDLPVEELQERVRNLPPDSAIFFLLMFRDRNGKVLKPYLVARQLAESASAPVFTHWDTLLGSGVVGGYLLSAERIGEITADAISAILFGSRPVTAAEVARRSFAHIFDSRALARHGLGTARLPQNAEIRYRQIGFWEQYRYYAAAAAVLIVFLSTLVVLLTVSLRHRRQALVALEQERNSLEARVQNRTRDLKREKDLAEKRARTDQLTGLRNRRALFEFGSAAQEQAKRYGRTYSVAVLDIDQFKLLNDGHGHAVGDAAIKAVAAAIISVARASDITARLGGDEFAVLAPETSAKLTLTLANRIKEKISKFEISVENETARITASIGIAEYQAGDESLDDVLARADAAMYRSKDRGRNRVCIFEAECCAPCSPAPRLPAAAN